MSRAFLILRDQRDRDRAKHWIDQAPPGTRLEFKAEKRTTAQSDKMWATLTDIATQLPWHGQKLRPDDWKLVLLAALKRELRLVPNIDGNGFVNIGTSSSDLTKAEMSDLIELAISFGTQHGIVFRGPSDEQGEQNPRSGIAPPDRAPALAPKESTNAGNLSQTEDA